MPDLLVMGVSAATTDTKHENTHLLLRGEHSTILIDCPAKSLQRTLEMGMTVDGISDMILTHFHPDHVGGFAGFMLDSWVLGRKTGLRVYGPHHCLKAIGDMMIAFEWGDWPGFFPLSCTHLSMDEDVPIIDNADFIITGMPMQHYVPTLGLRITSKKTGYTIAYSSDTSPCENVVKLSEGVDLLIHEAAGSEPLGHSSTCQAGEVAASAGAKMLALIHYNVWHPPFDHFVDEAKERYSGKVVLCTEGMVFPMGDDQD